MKNLKKIHFLSLNESQKQTLEKKHAEKQLKNMGTKCNQYSKSLL